MGHNDVQVTKEVDEVQAVMGDFLTNEDVEFLYPYAVTNQHAAFSLVCYCTYLFSGIVLNPLQP
jgi:hypothetical protein